MIITTAEHVFARLPDSRGVLPSAVVSKFRVAVLHSTTVELASQSNLDSAGVFPLTGAFKSIKIVSPIKTAAEIVYVGQISPGVQSRKNALLFRAVASLITIVGLV